jgi:predicted MFS family arabinose efflux permease
MLPLSMFKERNVAFGNLATIAIYAGLTISTFIIVIVLQQVAGFSALVAGFVMVPVTAIMFLLSGRFGALAGRHGPRFFMTAGPLIGAGGFLLMLSTGEPLNYWTQLLPGILVFGFGLSMTVAPLTSAILGSVPEDTAGIASAVNNAVARIAGLVAVALTGLVTGPVLTMAGFHRVLVLMATLLVAGGVISWFGIVNPVTAKPEPDRR